MELNNKLVRITTVPVSLKILLKGQSRFMSNRGFNVIGITSNGSELSEIEHFENIRIIPVEMTRSISPLKDLNSLWNLYKIFIKEKPQIVHTHTPKAGIVGMLAALLAGVPIRLHTVAGLPLLESKGSRRRLLDWVEKTTYWCATKVYPNSYGIYEIILNNKYTTANKIKVIGTGSSNGIDTSYFNTILFSERSNHLLKQNLNIQTGDFVFLFVGRLVGDKGINELVKAFKQVKNSAKSTKLLLVGGAEHELDPLLPETEFEIVNNPNINAVGYQEDVRPYFAIANVLVFPSYREGFPNVVMQAGSMNLPSIVSDINGCNEIIVEGKNGTIIPKKDTEALEKAMLKMINDKAYFDHLKSNAREMITSRYEQKVVWEALLEEYKTLLREKGLDQSLK